MGGTQKEREVKRGNSERDENGRLSVHSGCNQGATPSARDLHLAEGEGALFFALGVPAMCQMIATGCASACAPAYGRVTGGGGEMGSGQENKQNVRDGMGVRRGKFHRHLVGRFPPLPYPPAPRRCACVNVALNKFLRVAPRRLGSCLGPSSRKPEISPVVGGIPSLLSQPAPTETPGQARVCTRRALGGRSPFDENVASPDRVPFVLIFSSDMFSV